ncbi:hypothetical protein AMTRI_Chr11g155430 [Amborella trichopoda]
MSVNTSGVVLASSPPIAVAAIISRMLDGPLLGEEPADVKGKVFPMQNSNLDIMKDGCKSKGLNDDVVLRHLFARGTFLESQGKSP